MPPRNYTYPSIIEALQERGDMTRRELAEDLKCSPATVQDNIRRLLQDEKVHICDWLAPQGKGARAPVYRLGSGRNANWAVQSREERNAKKLGWAKARAMRNRIAAHAGNPFSSLIAQMSL